MPDSLNNPLNETGIETIQAEQKAWEESQFGLQPAWKPLLGISEEFGELCHAVLKMSQNIRGDADKHFADARDAIGDVLIYALGFCNRLNINAIEGVRNMQDYFLAQPRFVGVTDNVDWDIVIEDLKVPGFVIGNLMRYEEVPTDREGYVRANIAQLFWTLDKFSRAFTGEGAYTHLVVAWNEVKARKWKVNPENGKVPETVPAISSDENIKRAALISRGIPEMRVDAIIANGEDPLSPGYPVGYGCGSHD